MEKQISYYNIQDELDEELTINFKKILLVLWTRKKIIISIFLFFLCLFIFLTIWGTKKYTVTADLYINKGNSTHMAEINPYVLEDSSGSLVSLGSSNILSNELELIKSQLVIDNVIKENDIRYNKKFGIFPNKKEGELFSTADFIRKGKNPKFENKKGTNVISIKYTAKKPDIAYNVVSSIVTNYIELQKELQTEKSKFDTKILEKEYKNAQKELNTKLNQAGGITGQTDRIAAFAAFSTSSKNASSILKNQLLQGEKSKINITEEANKVAELSSKIQWAKLVEEMSASSKVLVLNAPYQLRDFEYSAPKPLMNIIMALIYGFIFSVIIVVIIEMRDKKLSYSMLSDNLIYSIDNLDLQTKLLTNNNRKITVVFFEEINGKLLEVLQSFHNVNLIKAEFTPSFVNEINFSESVATIVKVGKTNSQEYRQIKSIIKDLNKDLLFDVLL